MAAAASYFARGRSRVRREHAAPTTKYISEHDLTLTLADQPPAEPDRSGVFNLEEGTALKVVRETDAGIVVRGARILATLGPLSDEIAVYSPRVARHTETHSPFALNFAIPCATPGSSSCAARASTWAGPTSSTRSARASRRWTASSSSTMCWCRGSAWFLLGDVDLLNATATSTRSMTHTAHQGAAKNRQVRVRPRAGAPDGRPWATPTCRTPRASGRADAVHRAHEGLHTRLRADAEARRMGRHVPAHCRPRAPATSS